MWKQTCFNAFEQANPRAFISSNRGYDIARRWWGLDWRTCIGWATDRPLYEVTACSCGKGLT